MLKVALDCFLFGLVFATIALPLASRIPPGEPALRLALGIGGAIILIYLASFSIYLCEIRWAYLWVLPLAGVIEGWRSRHRLKILLTDTDVSAMMVGWLLLSSWCVGWQAMVISYSGGGWAGDWHEHYERALFYVHRWPLDFRFIGFNLLPARPPLANLVTAGFLSLAGDSLGDYQVFTTLLSTLVIFPLAALVKKLSGKRQAVSLLVILLMLNPLLVQNATFPWTKLVAAYFILLAVVVLPKPNSTPTGYGLALVALSAGLLAHYSTGPWVIALGITSLWTMRYSWTNRRLRHEVYAGLFTASVLMATWVAWGSWRFGATTMVHATSTVGLAPDTNWSGRIAIGMANIWHTLVPDWNSSILAIFLKQPDWFSRLRDLWFCLFQQNLPAALGLGNLCVIGWLVARNYFRPSAIPWLIIAPSVITIGSIVHTFPVDLGVTHICLQPMVLIGLAWIAASTETLPLWLRICWAIGLVCDFLLGIALHFGLQSLIFLRWSHPGIGDAELVERLNPFAGLNYHGKLRLAQLFIGDEFAVYGFVAPVLLGVIFGLALLQWSSLRRKTTFPSHQDPP